MKQTFDLFEPCTDPSCNHDPAASTNGPSNGSAVAKSDPVAAIDLHVDDGDATPVTDRR